MVIRGKIVLTHNNSDDHGIVEIQVCDNNRLGSRVEALEVFDKIRELLVNHYEGLPVSISSTASR